VAMRTMLRSWLEDGVEWEGVVRRSGGVKRVEAGLWIGGVFLDGRYGLDVAVGTDIVEEVLLETLLVGLADLPDGYEFAYGTGADADVSTDGDEEDKAVSTAPFIVNIDTVQTTAKGIIDVLLRRASNPTRDMKKRAKRKYLKRLKCCQGPTPRTIDMAVRLCLHGDREDGVGKAREILDTYGEMTFLGTAQEDTLKIVQEAEERLASKKKEEQEMVSEDKEDGLEDQDDEAKN